MEYRIPLIGEKFPEIEVKTTHGLIKLPEHFKGRWFVLFSHPMGEVAKRLGMIHPNKGTNTVRAVFIVDDKGTIRLILYYPQEVGRNIKEILRVVEALQISDKHGVAIPANWPENEITGRKVILPPPDSVQLAEERVEKAKSGKVECFDWWFCLKSVD